MAREPTAEELKYAGVLRWVNWAVQNDAMICGSMGNITNHAIARMGLPRPSEDVYDKIMLFVVRRVMNGPLHEDKGPEPKPFKLKEDGPIKPTRVELKVKDMRPVLVTPLPVEWN